MESKFARIPQPRVVLTNDIGEAMTALKSAGWLSEEEDARAFPSPGSAFKQVLRYSRWVLLGLSVFIMTSALLAQAEDDNENSTPTAWWIFTGQTVNDINNTIKTKNARIIDIKDDNSSANPFTVTYVQNTGSYTKETLIKLCAFHNRSS
jgi:hypothetical protein